MCGISQLQVEVLNILTETYEYSESYTPTNVLLYTIKY